MRIFGDFMKKNELIIVLAVALFIVIIGLAVYNTVMPLVPEEGHGKEEGKKEGFELLLKSADFMKGKTTYQFTTKEKIGDVEKTFFVSQDGKNAYIKETLLGISREVFYTENGSILCFDFLGERYCDIANDTKEMMIVDGFRGALFSDERAKRERKRFEVLEKAGGLEIYSVEKGEGGGRNCTLVKFKVDYSKLSLPELGEIGLSASDPAVSLVPYYNLTYCIAEDGEVLSKQISYVYKGQGIEEGFVVVDSDYEHSAIPPLPENFTDLSVAFQRHYNIFNEYLTCLETTEKDKCIASIGVKYLIPDMCEYAENKTKCYSIYVSFTLDQTICERFELPMKDYCIYTVALETKNETLCGWIANNSLVQECISSFTGNRTEEKQGTQNQTE
jgi:hypothetical protein